jgi:hypothetical protein
VEYQNARKRRTIDDVVRGTPKEQTFYKRRQTQRKCNNGIRDRALKQQLPPGSKGNVNETFRKILELEIAKKIARSSVRIRKMSVKTGSKRKKRLPTAEEPGMQERRPLSEVLPAPT